ncbi:hypothetical protein KBB96_19510 [Luteolibacter ambystomatis]|uniref:Uncharacterized protein n=1 Tax=Luteolibacter ambystomatis TaxID=2824561 RepID=A0A975J000_9BACT|nr:hypothetical protein [Luteolibacter ambystomatis]QUE51030.1 hypothetical protein KBB96_19510 [Luteolibacter ambystomatis]
MSDNSGTYMVVGGMILLVFGGIFLSVAADQRSSFLSANKAVNQDIRNNEELLTSLTPRLQRLKQLDATASPRLEQAAELEAIEGRLVDQQLQLDSLRTRSAALKTSLLSVGDSYEKYRTTYRKGIWDAAANEKMPELVLRNGRRYQDVTILRVTPVGLEISHSDGNARVSAADLDGKWQERFQWKDDERLEVLKREREALQQAANAPVPPVPSGNLAPAPAGSSNDLDRLQIEFNAWNAKVAALRAQRDEALSRSNGSSQSPPGTLETWAARATRLSGELDRAVQYCEQARRRLENAGRPQPVY